VKILKRVGPPLVSTVYGFWMEPPGGGQVMLNVMFVPAVVNVPDCSLVSRA